MKRVERDEGGRCTGRRNGIKPAIHEAGCVEGSVGPKSQIDKVAGQLVVEHGTDRCRRSRRIGDVEERIAIQPCVAAQVDIPGRHLIGNACDQVTGKAGDDLSRRDAGGAQFIEEEFLAGIAESPNPARSHHQVGDLSPPGGPHRNPGGIESTYGRPSAGTFRRQ